MIHIIVGHRGTGKTSFLARVQKYFHAVGLPVQTHDLDSAIESTMNRSVQDIFAQEGEATFRQLERDTFNRLVSEARGFGGQVFISVGGGFSGEIPVGTEVLWLRRPTDSVGRVFLDRPRLNSAVSALDEYRERFESREARFSQIHHRELMLVEGMEEANSYEPIALGLRPANVGMSVTLLPIHIENPLRLENFIQDSLQVGAKYIELRDDLLSEEQILGLVAEIPHERILLSFRSGENSEKLKSLRMNVATDWAVELGQPDFEPTVVSIHDRQDGETFEQLIARLQSIKGQHYKLAVPVRSFDELWAGHRFFTADPRKNSFLPRSEDGRWAWYRAFMGAKMQINFFRFGFGSSLDQPTLMDVLRVPKEATHFSAVLGSPVMHSRSPIEHQAFFSSIGIPFFAIRMEEEECTTLNLSLLQKLGMLAAAVTSPLKEKVYGLCDQADRRAEELRSVNTIYFNPSVDGWAGTNTDVIGLEKVFASLDLPEELAIWGGGGTRSSLRNLFPNARFFSARYGEELWVEKKSSDLPRVVVWAVPRARMGSVVTPPPQWAPEVVFDLNYTEDSPGREYAQQIRATYISGLAFFRAQAVAQREFWKRTGQFDGAKDNLS